MAEIEFTIPTVQYGNIKVRMTPEELMDPEMGPYGIGMKAQEFLILATLGFEDAKRFDFQAPPALDVTGQYQESSEAHVHNFRGPYCDCGAVDEEELKAEELIKSKLGATTVEPWTQTPETKPKAWDNFDI